MLALMQKQQLTIFIQTAKTFAGFKPAEPYFVARSHLDLPDDVETCAAALLPQLARWRQEQNSRLGDKSIT